MNLRNRLPFGVAVVTAFTLGVAGPAYAGSVTGIWGYYGPQAGISYQNQNAVYTNGPSGPEYAYTTASTQGGNAPAGYMGVTTRLYAAATGFMWADNGPSYSSGNIVSMSLPAGNSTDLHQYFYAKGLTYAYNGNGYNTYESFQSPNIFGDSN